MDHNETNAKPLNRDSFPEVKEINKQKKENTGYQIISGARTRSGQQQKWAKPHTLSNWHDRKGSHNQKAVPEITQRFRIVRDSRMDQFSTKDLLSGPLQNSLKENHQNAQNKSASGNLINLGHLAGGSTDGCGLCLNLNGSSDFGPCHVKDEQSSGIDKESPLEEKPMHISDVEGIVQSEVKIKSQAHSEKNASANSTIGVYPSSSDPVHVPSSRSSSAVGAIQREVGAVGIRRRTSESAHSVTIISGSGYSSYVPFSERNPSSSRQTTTSFKSSRPNPLPSMFPRMPVKKYFAASQYDSKVRHQINGRLKSYNASNHPNMEWKPKASQKANVDDAHVATQSRQMQANALSDTLLQVNLSKSEHVIIPQHLQVPEAERCGLTFGSFGTESSVNASKDTVKSSNGPSLSTSTSNPVHSIEDSVEAQSVPVDCQARTYSSDNSASAADPEVHLPANNDSLCPRDIGTYPDVGMIQNYSAFYTLQEQSHSLKNQSSLANYPGYDSHMMFDMPFSKTSMEDNAQDQGLSSVYEDSSPHLANNSSCSGMSMVQQQQQQQAFTQLYPQINMSHYPNFMPYQQMFSPMYVPQLLVPNYLNNSAHVHPSTGSNYLMVTGGCPQAPSSNMKYGAPQFKPVQAGNPTSGYGSYTNPSGYMVGDVRSAAGMGEMTGINFKDNNVYAPNLQPDTDIWIQTPRDLASLQPTQCYNLPGDAQAHPTYLPARGHAANQALNPVAFASSHLQYPGFYQPPPPGSANSAIGIVPTAATEVGASQLGHLGWSSNF